MATFFIKYVLSEVDVQFVETLILKVTLSPSHKPMSSFFRNYMLEY